MEQISCGLALVVLVAQVATGSPFLPGAQKLPALLGELTGTCIHAVPINANTEINFRKRVLPDAVVLEPYGEVQPAPGKMPQEPCGYDIGMIFPANWVFYCGISYAAFKRENDGNVTMIVRFKPLRTEDQDCRLEIFISQQTRAEEDALSVRAYSMTQDEIEQNLFTFIEEYRYMAMRHEPTIRMNFPWLEKLLPENALQIVNTPSLIEGEQGANTFKTRSIRLASREMQKLRLIFEDIALRNMFTGLRL